jgi:hypothetical protein
MEFWPLKTLSEVSGVLLGLQLSPTPNMGVHSLTLFALPGACDITLGFTYRPTTLQPPCLGREPRLGLRQKMCFVSNLASQFLSCSDHLQFIVFLHCDCYQKVARLAKLQPIVYTVQIIATQLQLCQNHSFSTTMQLHYNYNHNVILTLVIFIHPSIKIWHMALWKKFDLKKFDLHHLLWLLMVQNYDMWHNLKKIPHGILF